MTVRNDPGFWKSENGNAGWNPEMGMGMAMREWERGSGNGTKEVEVKGWQSESPGSKEVETLPPSKNALNSQCFPWFPPSRILSLPGNIHHYVSAV